MPFEVSSNNYNNIHMWTEPKSLNINNQLRIELPPHINNPNSSNIYFCNSIPRIDIYQNELALHQYDFIPFRSDYLGINLTNICCQLIHPLQCSEIWKIVHVVPIVNVNNSKYLSDLKSVRIRFQLSKLVDKILADQLKTHLNSTIILHRVQSGISSDFFLFLEITPQSHGLSNIFVPFGGCLSYSFGHNFVTGISVDNYRIIQGY